MAVDDDMAGGQLIGARRRQEDAYRLERAAAGRLLVVADGMGGHVGGAEASRLAVDAVADRAVEIALVDDAAAALRTALDDANGAIASAARARPQLFGMGTTLTAVLLREAHAHWVSVGDSPLWALNRRGLVRLNADHSPKAALQARVARGELSPEEAARHPERHLLLSALTGAPLELVDAGSAELDAGGLVVLASDGIDTLAEAELEDLLQAAGGAAAPAIVERCLEEVERRLVPYQDNVTLLVARVATG